MEWKEYMDLSSRPCASSNWLCDPGQISNLSELYIFWLSLTASLGLEPEPILGYLREVPQDSGFAQMANCRRGNCLAVALGEKGHGH